MSFFSTSHEKLIRKFVKHRVDFVLIGGHAAIFHGVRRTTSDIDILIQPTLKNGDRIITAFKDLGLDVSTIKSTDFLKEQVFSFGMEPHAVDILNFSKGVSVDDIFKNSITRKLDGLQFRIIDIRDLIQNKKKLNRDTDKSLIDEYDVRALTKILKSKKDN